MISGVASMATIAAWQSSSILTSQFYKTFFLSFLVILTIMSFLLGNFVQALKDENVYNATSLNKLIIWKRIPTTMEGCSVVTLLTPIQVHTKPLENLD